MPSDGTTRLYRPDPASASESKRYGRGMFSVRHPAGARIRVAASGEIDAVNGRALGTFVERHTGISKQLIVDLRAVDFFGTQGFTALYYISVHCTRSDVDWMLVGGPPVRRILQICDPDGELPFVEDLQAAVGWLDHLAQLHPDKASSVG